MFNPFSFFFRSCRRDATFAGYDPDMCDPPDDVITFHMWPDEFNEDCIDAEVAHLTSSAGSWTTISLHDKRPACPVGRQ
tara:strand:- start:543 stop:779 length:237 start_codon:yes stop_codon:yes gene_type:complete